MICAPCTDTIFTVGHSNRSLPEFLDVLNSAGVRILVDVRRFPASRRHPHFNLGSLTEALASLGIVYHHLPELGGYREPPTAISPSPNDGWPPGFLRNYADYTMTERFQEALRSLRQLSGPQLAVMCAERQWTDCHRQIIADYLIVGGHEVIHLIDATNREDGQLTSFAKLMEDGRICYFASPVQLQLDL
ncbi:uncharacterized protein (DUF488 family) [Bradyrhizobium japonicum]|jgi:uncharacterized protein (DUF488 family)|uniref:DUF488 domain-containing protein n=1 Tax=Bradyrhizobium japonicum TaxID=375 RepID=UPI00339AA451